MIGTLERGNDTATCGPIDTLLTRLGSLTVPLPVPRGPLVYFLRERDEVKIGFTHRLTQRMQQLGAGKLTLLGTVPGTTTTERMYHQRFANLKISGEWFRAEPELLDAIAVERADPPPAPGYAEVALAFRKKNRAYITSPGNSPLIFAQTNVGFWLNMLAEGETPERLAGLEDAIERLNRVTDHPKKS